MTSDKTIRRTALAEDVGSRLDKWLSALPEVGSRSRATTLIERGLVRVNGKSAKASQSIKLNDNLEFELPAKTDDGPLPMNLELDVLFEDSDVLVVNKPAGLVVHPAAGHAADTLVNALVAHTDDLAMGFDEARPGIVHRLDKETSGLLVVAKNDAAQKHLVEQFQNRTIIRSYEALCYGQFKGDSGRIESWLARHPVDRKRFASIRGKDGLIQRTEPAPKIGKWAATRYQVLSSVHGLSFMKMNLETGRTHQIRVHLSELGHPLVGDDVYGRVGRAKNLASVALRRDIEGLDRFFLHAKELGFVHPKTGKELFFSRDWPEAARAFLDKWGFPA